MIVLVLVAVLWIAVLVPTILSKWSERRSAGSIGRFHQRLDLLERTGPKLVQPAYRLTGTAPGAEAGVPLVVPVSPPPVRPTLTLVSDADASIAQDPDHEREGFMDEEEFALHLANAHEAHSEWVEEGDEGAGGRAEHRRTAADRRRLARRRRRDVFAALCALAAVTGLVGFAHPLRGAWVASAVFLALLIGFVGLAAYGQHLESERRHLARLSRGEPPSASVPEPTNIRYLTEDELDLYYEGLDDERLVAEG